MNVYKFGGASVKDAEGVKIYLNHQYPAGKFNHCRIGDGKNDRCPGSFV